MFAVSDRARKTFSTDYPVNLDLISVDIGILDRSGVFSVILYLISMVFLVTLDLYQ